jgi:hypothetical protein
MIFADHPGTAAIEVVTLVSLGALAWKVTSVLKYVTAGQFREAVTQLVPWVGAWGILAAAAASGAADSTLIWGHQTLGDMNVWGLLLAGISLGSGASVGYDLKKARDNSDEAGEPPLGGRALERLDRHAHRPK